MKPSIFFATLFLFLFSACQSDQKPTQIEDKKTTFANFYLRYLQTENKVKGEAFFRKGEDAKKGSAIEYQQGVYFNGGSMSLKQLVGRKLYRTERKSDFNGEYTFEVNRNEPDAFTHTAKINPISSFNIENGLLKKSGCNLNWTGSKLSSNEELVLLLTDHNNRAFNIIVPGPTTNTFVEITGDKIAKMESGKGSLYLVRKYKEEIKKEGLQINALAEFYTNSIPIEVVE